MVLIVNHIVLYLYTYSHIYVKRFNRNERIWNDTRSLLKRYEIHDRRVYGIIVVSWQESIVSNIFRDIHGIVILRSSYFRLRLHAYLHIYYIQFISSSSWHFLSKCTPLCVARVSVANKYHCIFDWRGCRSIITRRVREKCIFQTIDRSSENNGHFIIRFDVSMTKLSNI